MGQGMQIQWAPRSGPSSCLEQNQVCVCARARWLESPARRTWNHGRGRFCETKSRLVTRIDASQRGLVWAISVRIDRPHPPRGADLRCGRISRHRSFQRCRQGCCIPARHCSQAITQLTQLVHSIRVDSRCLGS